MGEFESFLSGYDELVRELAARARELIREIVPEAQEKVYSGGWKTVMYSVGAKAGSRVCGIQPQKDRINLILFRTDLSDPKGLLEGAGSTGRHVKIGDAVLLESSEVRALISECARLVGSESD